jgi:hypothetical protein
MFINKARTALIRYFTVVGWAAALVSAGASAMTTLPTRRGR